MKLWPRILVSLAAALLLGACGSSSSSSSGSSATGGSSSQGSTLGYEGVLLEQGPELATASTTQTGTVDGISCVATEQLAYHIHAHLQVYVAGSPRVLPAGVGIPGSVAQQTSQGPVAAGGQCIYWLHTHTSDGVIHVESPTARGYTLGEFFDEWHQPLSAAQVAGATGKVTAYVNAKPWGRSPRAIPLMPHAVIQLDVGTQAPTFQNFSWSGTQL